MAEVWPADLPQVLLVDGFSEEMGDSRIQSDPDSGPPKIRNRFSNVADKIAGQMILTYAQLVSLRDFVRLTTDGGALAFTLPSQYVAGETDLLCTFDEMPVFTALGAGRYRAALSLRVLP